MSELADETPAYVVILPDGAGYVWMWDEAAATALVGLTVGASMRIMIPGTTVEDDVSTIIHRQLANTS